MKARPQLPPPPPPPPHLELFAWPQVRREGPQDPLGVVALRRLPFRRRLRLLRGDRRSLRSARAPTPQRFRRRRRRWRRRQRRRRLILLLLLLLLLLLRRRRLAGGAANPTRTPATFPSPFQCRCCSCRWWWRSCRPLRHRPHRRYGIRSLGLGAAAAASVRRQISATPVDKGSGVGEGGRGWAY